MLFFTFIGYKQVASVYVVFHLYWIQTGS